MTKSPRIDLRPGISKPVLLMISRRQVEEADIAVAADRKLTVGGAAQNLDWLSDDPKACPIFDGAK